MIQRMVANDPMQTINLVDGDQRRILGSLQTGETELALLYDLHLPDELGVIPLTQFTPYVLLADGHPLANKSALTPTELAEYPMVNFGYPAQPELLYRNLGKCRYHTANCASFFQFRNGTRSGWTWSGLYFACYETGFANDI